MSYFFVQLHVFVMHIMYVDVVSSFSLLYSILLYNCIVIYLSIPHFGYLLHYKYSCVINIMSPGSYFWVIKCISKSYIIFMPINYNRSFYCMHFHQNMVLLNFFIFAYVVNVKHVVSFPNCLTFKSRTIET